MDSPDSDSDSAQSQESTHETTELSDTSSSPHSSSGSSQDTYHELQAIQGQQYRASVSTAVLCSTPDAAPVETEYTLAIELRVAPNAPPLSLYIPARSAHDSVPASLNTSAETSPSYPLHGHTPLTAFSTTPFAECVIALSQTQSDTHPLTDGFSVSISDDGDTITLNGDPTLTYPLYAGSLPALAEQTSIHEAIDNLVTALEYGTGQPGFDATLTRAVETADRHLHVTVESQFGTHTFSIQLEQTPPSPTMAHLMEQLAGFSPESSSLTEPVRLLFFGAHHPPPSQFPPLGPDTDDRWVFLPRKTATRWNEQISTNTQYTSLSKGGLAALGSALASVVALTVGLLGLPVSASTPHGQLLVVSARLSIVLFALFLAGVLARTVGAEWASA